MQSISTSPQTMDPYLFPDVLAVGTAIEKMRRRFATMATPTTLQRSVFEGYPHLEITTDDDGLG